MTITMWGNMARMNESEITPGMKREATQGKPGDHDARPVKSTEALRNQQEAAKILSVEKGTFIPKKLNEPADCIQEFDRSGELAPAEVKTAVTKSERETPTTLAEQVWPHAHGRPQESLLEQVAQQVRRAQCVRWRRCAARPRNRFWQVIGSGLLSGTSGNDPSAVTTYAIDGATTGYGHLWLMLLSTPLYQAVQFACAKIGRVSNKGLSQLLREHYGRPVAVIASLLLILTNVALIAADLTAIGSGLELVSGLSWIWFVVPVAFVLWYLTISHTFEAFKKIFLTISLVFVACVLAAFSSHAAWGIVLARTFVPPFGFDFESISNVVALLGATISPYSMFWQVEGEIEEQRIGMLRQQLHAAKWDVGSGAISGQAVAYFIIVTTASTLFMHHANVNTATEAVRALGPLAGPLIPTCALSGHSQMGEIGHRAQMLCISFNL
jgi:NRAMP (natural resistance-associated macrophage protein)-like metal ion transporter